MMATRRGLAVDSDDIWCYLHDRKYVTRAIRKRAQISSRILDSMIADRSRFVTERSFAALRACPERSEGMTARTPLKSTHGKPSLQISGCFLQLLRFAIA